MSDDEGWNADWRAGQKVEPVAWWDGDLRLTRHKTLPGQHVWERIIPLYTHPAPSQEGHTTGPACSAPDEALIEEIARDALRALDDAGNYLHTDAAVKWAIREYIRRIAGKEKG